MKYIFVIEEDVKETKHLYRFLSHLVYVKDLKDSQLFLDDNDIIGADCSEDIACEIASFDCVDEVIEV